ncbi:MAG: flagellar basal body rod protein FlgB [Deltaproteobacteria bacterium]|nr:flagellar basal body rod protein FlgB [Deltaproteobacteria bacterium]
MKLFDESYSAMEKALDLRFKRHTVLASNIANTETPNFRAREVDFAGELKKAVDGAQQALAKTNPGHMDVTSAEGNSHIVYDNATAMGADGNNVDLDIAMGKISENARTYSGVANYLSMKLRLLRQVTRGGTGGV